MDRSLGVLANVYYALIPILGVVWILSVPQLLGISMVAQEIITVILGLAIAATFIKHPYGEKAGWPELIIGLAGLAAWAWSAGHYVEWLTDIAERGPEKWVPGVIGIVILMEALRKTSGTAIAILVWVLLAYAFFGYLMPGVLEAEKFPATKIVLYNYADSNGVPGLVLRIVCTIVLAFIVFGRLLEVSGATTFFTDLAMGWMGHRRGGPAKVAVVASSAFGMVSGSSVGNIMSTGVVTIPLMKRSGFKSEYAAGIEAVASNGGQFAPPIMGATAFLIADFLQIGYVDVVIAAAIPAFLYYLVLFMQVDSIAVRFGLKGLDRAELPVVLTTLLSGWVYLIPIAVLLYFLFWLSFNPATSAVYAIGTLLVLMIVRKRRFLTIHEIKSFVFGSGENLLPIVLIGGAAGIVIGVMNSTGLAFQLTLILAEVGNNAGLMAMLLLTALISIILGMGMPTAAVYIVLATVLAPAMEELGVKPLAAHLFLFYFGLLSMLTPPVAVASYVAAGLAGSNMWSTGWIGIRLAVVAYLVPFLWIFNPALIFIGTPTAIAYAVLSAIVAGLMLARALQDLHLTALSSRLLVLALVAGALAIGSSTIWIGTEAPGVLIACAIGIAVILVLKRIAPEKALDPAQM